MNIAVLFNRSHPWSGTALATVAREVARDVRRIEAELPADPVRTELASTHQPTNGARGHGQLLGHLRHGQQRPWVRLDRSIALLPWHGISPWAGRCGAARGHGARE